MAKTVEESRNIASCSMKEAQEVATHLISSLPAEECPPMLFIGPVGCGKTESILQVAREVTPFGFKQKGLHPLVRHLSQVHPLDMGGVGLDNAKREMYYAEPPLYNEWRDQTKEGKTASITFLDEIDRAQPIAQSSMLQYLLSREINGYKCTNNYAIAAANGWHAQYTYELDKAAASRFVIMHMEPRKDDWMKWASENQVDIRVLVTIEQCPDVLNQHGGFSANDKDNSTNDGALKIADPRAWKRLSDALKAGFPIEHSDTFVGVNAAKKLELFAQVQKTYAKQIKRVLDKKPSGLTMADVGDGGKAGLERALFCIYLSAGGQIRDIETARAFLKNGIDELDKERVYIASNLITYNIPATTLCEDKEIQKLHIEIYNETHGEEIKG